MTAQFPPTVPFLSPLAVLTSIQGFKEGEAATSSVPRHHFRVQRAAMSSRFVALLRWGEFRNFATTHAIPWPMESSKHEAYAQWELLVNKTMQSPLCLHCGNGEHDRLEASFLTGLRSLRRWRCWCSDYWFLALAAELLPVSPMLIFDRERSFGSGRTLSIGPQAEGVQRLRHSLVCGRGAQRQHAVLRPGLGEGSTVLRHLRRPPVGDQQYLHGRR